MSEPDESGVGTCLDLPPVKHQDVATCEYQDVASCRPEHKELPPIRFDLSPFPLVPVFQRGTLMSITCADLFLSVALLRDDQGHRHFRVLS
jgi:hypothetical protein